MMQIGQKYIKIYKNMNLRVQELIDKSVNLLKEIEVYIKSVPNWIYYFLPPTLKTDSKNYPLKEYVLEHQDDWMDEIDISVISFNGASVKVELSLPPDEEAPVFERYLILSHFESEVEFNKKAMDGQLNDYTIKELNEEISYHKEQLRLATLELNKLIEDGIKQAQKDNNG